jgi:hypothetical protein
MQRFRIPRFFCSSSCDRSIGSVGALGKSQTYLLLINSDLAGVVVPQARKPILIWPNVRCFANNLEHLVTQITKGFEAGIGVRKKCQLEITTRIFQADPAKIIYLSGHTNAVGSSQGGSISQKRVTQPQRAPSKLQDRDTFGI